MPAPAEPDLPDPHDPGPPDGHPDGRPDSLADARADGHPDGLADGWPDQLARRWRDSFAGLTPAQRRAVEHAAGPLAVLAGPGAGKTRVIVHRIAHMILTREVKPEQVVGVTFSVKAAGEMRERLGELLGPRLAERLTIRTFHGLGYRILRRFGDLIGLPSEPELIDSAQRRRLLRELMIQHGLFAEHVGLGRESALEMIDEHLAAFNNHAISPEQARRFAREWAGAPGLFSQQRETDAQRVRRFEEIVRLAELFSGACRERGWLSFDDLITLPTRLLASRPLAASVIGGEWRHFVVDEFQDVNRAQIEMLKVLAPPPQTAGPADGPDLCVVGDDDQSIYEFRGADEQAFAKFTKTWPGHALVELEENHRSSRPVIALANEIMSRADPRHRYAPHKRVLFPAARAAEPDAEGAAAIAVKLKDDKDDADVIAMMILTERRLRPHLRLSDMAVIARSGSDLERVAAALAMEGIPSARQREGGVLLDQGVQDLLAWVELLNDPRATWAARRLLVRPPCSAPADRVTDWERAYRSQRSRFDAGDAVDDPGSFVHWLSARVSSPGAGPAGGEPHAQAVDRLRGLYDELRADAAIRGADEVIFRIITLADLAHADLLPARDRTRRVSALLSVLRFARVRQARLDPPGDLGAFAAYYQDLETKEKGFDDRGLAEVDPAEAGPERPDAQADDADESADAGDGAVQLVTAHSAKGLEFDTVFVTRVSSLGFPSARHDETDLPDGLIDRAGDTRTPAERRGAEERRVFYVACSRARRKVVLLGKWNKHPSSAAIHFFDELLRDRQADDQVVAPQEVGDVIRLARDVGVGSPARDSIAVEADYFLRMGAMRSALTRARRDARVAAAAALDGLDRPGVDSAALDEAARALREAAGRLALAASVERRAARPDWLLEPGAPAGWTELDARLRAIAQAADAKALKLAAARGGLVLPPMAPPLRLSYSVIRDYLACPRCFYVKRVFNLPDRDAPQASLGRAIHGALQQFYRRWAHADAEGHARPGLAALLDLGRREFFRLATGDRIVDKEHLAQLTVQLTSAYERLHSEQDHVLELERSIEFKYARGAHEHDFTAKIDRIDQLAARDGGGRGEFRVIDYKTGSPTKKLLQPKADDLQLGLYALALQTTLNGAPLCGWAEYWVLSTGERGAIRLEALALDKVRATVDKAIDGMLAGDFKPGSPERGCSGLCSLLGG